MLGNLEKSKQKTLAKDKKEFVSCIITNPQGNVLILKRRQDLKLDPGKYDFCSGHIKEGEIPMQSMYRELNEEIGLKPEQIRLMEKIGIIGNPHPRLDLLDITLCTIFHAEIDLELEKINKMIKEVEEPEMEEAMYLENLEKLKEEMQNKDSKMRVLYTKQMRYAIEAIGQRMDRKMHTLMEKLH